MTSERDFINSIQEYVQKYGHERESLIKGIGDDCAVLAKAGEDCLLLTTDTLVEGVHFDLAWHPPYLLGRKCASVNLSDIAAMGGQPKICLLSIGFHGAGQTWFDEFMAGFTKALEEYDVLLVGGDTVKSSNELIISVTVLGEGNREQIRYRSGAKPGDLVWVSGPLGCSAAGLELCRKTQSHSVENADRQQLVNAHLDPHAEVDLGIFLAACGLVHAMIDVSDGLATDLAHLCQVSNVGAEIQQDLLPVSESLEGAARELNVNVFDWVLKGGEDYQLLFTTGPEDEQKLRQLVTERFDRDIFRLGKIIDEQGVFLCNGTERHDISYQGYDHFSGQ
ncbi:MAG: thiamine-phosphate kinase [Deltaproteobacteria bacterium]|jgi:thiamine-monophosphate kinase|nr:thiamine-phosphate kinase [Deltaproteobacteria bacterium]